MHTRWSRVGWWGFLVAVAVVAAGCRERTPADRYPTNLGTDEQPLLPTPVGAYRTKTPDGSAQIVVYEPGAPVEASQDEGAEEAPVDQPATPAEAEAGGMEPPQITDAAGTPPSAEDEAVIRELCQAIADAGPGQLDRFVVSDQQARVQAIMGPMQDLADVLQEISDGSETAPQSAGVAKLTREQIVGALAGSADEITDIRMLDADRATAKRGGRDVFFERAGDRWLVRIPDLPEEDKTTDFVNALRDMVDAFEGVADGLESGELTDAAAVERMTAAAQQFASQVMGANP
ncbi:MAG: hypothetical protein JXB13_19045 [Phycisphaerae bacterium]|nr:hypothetical protein [Phycisphaerae bacterium]